jgi:hypothetical protein
MTTLYLKNLTQSTKIAIVGNNSTPNTFIDTPFGSATVDKSSLISNSTYCNKVRSLITAGTLQVRLNNSTGTILATTDIDDIQAGTDLFPDPVSVVETVYFVSEYDNGNSGVLKTINWANGQQQKLTLTGNCVLTFTGLNGPSRFTLKLIQGGIGGFSVTWPVGTFGSAAAAPALTAAVGSVDILAIYYDGTQCHVGMAISDSKVIP